MLEIFLFILVAGLTAFVIGASVHEGIFVGALVSPLLDYAALLKLLQSRLGPKSVHSPRRADAVRAP